MENHPLRSKMSALQAALGLVQAERKRRIFGWYRERLTGVEGLTLNHGALDTRNTYWMVTAIFDPALGLRKEEMMEALDGRGVDTRPFFDPLSSLAAYADSARARDARERTRSAIGSAPGESTSRRL